MPITPISERICKYCNDPTKINDENHFVMFCKTFSQKRACLFGKISSVNPNFFDVPKDQLVSKLLCPVEAKIGKLVNKFISIMSAARNRLDKGENLDVGSFTNAPSQVNRTAVTMKHSHCIYLIQMHPLPDLAWLY